MRCNKDGIRSPHICHPFRTRQVKLEQTIDTFVHGALAVERYVCDFCQRFFADAVIGFELREHRLTHHRRKIG